MPAVNEQPSGPPDRSGGHPIRPAGGMRYVAGLAPGGAEDAASGLSEGGREATHPQPAPPPRAGPSFLGALPASAARPRCAPPSRGRAARPGGDVAPWRGGARPSGPARWAQAQPIRGRAAADRRLASARLTYTAAAGCAAARPVRWRRSGAGRAGHGRRVGPPGAPDHPQGGADMTRRRKLRRRPPSHPINICGSQLCRKRFSALGSRPASPRSFALLLPGVHIAWLALPAGR